MAAWKDIDDLEKAMMKCKYLKKSGCKSRLKKANVFEMEIDGFLFSRFLLEAKLGTELTTYHFPLQTDYPDGVIGYKPITQHLKTFKVRDFVFGTVKPQSEYSINSLLEMLFHLAKKDLDPLSKALNKSGQVMKLVRNLYKRWDPLRHAYEGNLFPIVGDPATAEGYLLQVTLDDQLRNLEEICELANYIASILASMRAKKEGDETDEQ